MEFYFSEHDKKIKSAFLKGLENINQIVKNFFEVAYFNNEGVCYNNTSELTGGRASCETTMHEVIPIKDNQLVKIYTRPLYECIKAGKTKIEGYRIENDEFRIFTTESEYLIGTYLNNEILNLEKIKQVESSPAVLDKNLNFLLESFENKNLIELDLSDEYKCIITHKLFPCAHKCKTIHGYVFDCGDGTFVCKFVGRIEERNKKDEVTFSMQINYYYKFLKL